MEINKIKSYVGFAIRSREIVLGTDNILKSKKIKLILSSDVIAESAEKKLSSHAEKNGIQFFKLSKEEFEKLEIKQGVLVIGITQKDLSGAIVKNL